MLNFFLVFGTLCTSQIHFLAQSFFWSERKAFPKSGQIASDRDLEILENRVRMAFTSDLLLAWSRAR